MLQLGFKDDSGTKFMSVERRILAATTCYDIYDTKGECVAKVDRELFSATPVYKFYYEGDSNPFPDFKAEGPHDPSRLEPLATPAPICQLRVLTCCRHLLESHVHLLRGYGRQDCPCEPRAGGVP